MASSPAFGQPASARERARRAMSAEIAGEAMQLFLEQGFEQTTIEQIAAASGVSTRSVSRYFATKEDMVVGRLAAVGQDIAGRLAQRPPEESPWVAMRRALDGETESFDADPQTLMATATMLKETPALRGAIARKHEEWEALLVPLLARRCGPPGRRSEMVARTIVAATAACLTIAVEEWRATEGTCSVADALDDALAVMRT